MCAYKKGALPTIIRICNYQQRTRIICINHHLIVAIKFTLETININTMHMQALLSITTVINILCLYQHWSIEAMHIPHESGERKANYRTTVTNVILLMPYYSDNCQLQIDQPAGYTQSRCTACYNIFVESRDYTPPFLHASIGQKWGGGLYAG